MTTPIVVLEDLSSSFDAFGLVGADARAGKVAGTIVVTWLISHSCRAGDRCISAANRRRGQRRAAAGLSSCSRAARDRCWHRSCPARSLSSITICACGVSVRPSGVERTTGAGYTERSLSGSRRLGSGTSYVRCSRARVSMNRARRLLSCWRGSGITHRVAQSPLGAAPVTFDIGLALVVARSSPVVHIGYVMLRIVRPTARTATPTAVGAHLVADAAAHLAYADELARAGPLRRSTRASVPRARARARQAESAALPRIERRPLVRGEARLTERGARVARRSRRAAVSAPVRAVPCDPGEYATFGEAARVGAGQ